MDSLRLRLDSSKGLVLDFVAGYVGLKSVNKDGEMRESVFFLLHLQE